MIWNLFYHPSRQQKAIELTCKAFFTVALNKMNRSVIKVSVFSVVK